MMRIRLFMLIVLMVILSSESAGAIVIDPQFSIDPASPSIDQFGSGITPDDVLVSGPIISIYGTDLGLVDDVLGGNLDNLNALSFGKDPIENPLYFSVDRVAVGLPGSAVHSQAQPPQEEAAGDVFCALPSWGGNTLFRDEEVLGLIPGFFGDDLNALELETPSVSDPNYFSIDFLSASNDFGLGTKANDILINNVGAVFAEGETHMDLDPEDDLDALVLWDMFEPGVLNPGLDFALFSLDTFSPSTFTFTGNPYQPGVKGHLSPADVLWTDFTGYFTLWAAASAIGLKPDDELNALDTPEPGTVLSLTIILGIIMSRRRRSSRRINNETRAVADSRGEGS